jgi:hypothetical protein
MPILMVMVGVERGAEGVLPGRPLRGKEKNVRDQEQLERRDV